MREAIRRIKRVLQGVFLSGLLIFSTHHLVFGQPSKNVIEAENLIHAVSNEVAEQRDIVVNEILYRRESAGSPEFVELFNRSYKTINLQNWELVIGSGSVQVAEPIELKSNDLIVFTDHEGFAGLSDKIYYLPGFPVLTDNGSSVAVYSDEEVLIDSLFYQPDWGEINRGVSLERKDPGGLSVDPSNWSESLSETGATPGVQNSQYKIDLLPPEILFASLNGDSLFVYFDEFIRYYEPETSGEPEFNAEIIPRFFVNEQLLNVIKFNSRQANRVVLDAGFLTAGEELVLYAQNLTDFKGNTTSTSQVIAQPLESGALIFNEVMYHPLSGDDNFSGQSEYLEIYNRMPYTISLAGIFLHDEPDEGGEFNSMEPINGEMKWIPSNGYALLFPENQKLLLSESRTGIAFGLSTEVDPFGLRFDRAGLGLVLAGRTVYLADSTGKTIDRVDYNPLWHNPNLISTQGISLERINPDLDTNEAENWSSSTNVMGGTPMGQNSLFRTAEQNGAGSMITLSPNPFSPDGDGFDDNLEISYRFDEPDYLLKVRIYDRYGRLVRKLADGYPAGLHGSLFWDGKMDGGNRGRVGIYIVYVQAYNASSGGRIEFKETAVLARKF